MDFFGGRLDLAEVSLPQPDRYQSEAHHGCFVVLAPSEELFPYPIQCLLSAGEFPESRQELAFNAS
jgi:hypothetical protein